MKRNSGDMRIQSQSQRRADTSSITLHHYYLVWHGVKMWSIKKKRISSWYRYMAAGIFVQHVFMIF